VTSGLPEATLLVQKTGASEEKSPQAAQRAQLFLAACRVDQQRVFPCRKSDKPGNATLYGLLHRN